MQVNLMLLYTYGCEDFVEEVGGVSRCEFPLETLWARECRNPTALIRFSGQEISCVESSNFT